jgi:hypothetical protein
MKPMIAAALVGLLATIVPELGSAQKEPNPLPAERLVNKISMVTTGRPASKSTIARFYDAVTADPNDFQNLYTQLIDEHLARPEYSTTIEHLHALWWRISFGTVAKHAGYVVATDRSYEEIYVRDYIYADSTIAPVYRQLRARTLTDLPTMPGEVRKVPLSRDELRFRGLFGSPEFLYVYPDTPTNVNRKRSSQVFRIAFCETLSNNSAELNKIHALLEPLDDEHGQNPDCMGCHRRLDPMARFFDHWLPPNLDNYFASYDPTRPSHGKVYLGGTSGMEREYPGSGDGDLGAIVIQQPEFSACVANLAWQYAFGREVALDDGTRSQLVATYERTKRFNSIVKASLLHPYFWSDTVAPELNYSNIGPIFLGCSGCHARTSGTQFDPSTYPFKSDPTANFNLIRRIWGAINHYSGYRPMPDAPRPKLPQESLDTIRTWISHGGQDAAGTKTLSEDQVEEILQ